MSITRRVSIDLVATAVLAGLAATLTLAAPPAHASSECQDIGRATLQERNPRTPEVSTEELRQILAEGRALVLDGRPHLEWAISHIPGALNVAPKPGVPKALYVSDVAEIGRLTVRKDTPIVLYCNGPFCGKSKRLAEELLAAGYTAVRRYQLGIPTWRALGGLTQIEPDGIRYVLGGDRTAVFIDARSPAEFQAGSLAGARNVAPADAGLEKAKNDGRLPMDDHNTRVVVFGGGATQARALAEAIARNAFHNVAYYDGTFETLKAVMERR